MSWEELGMDIGTIIGIVILIILVGPLVILYWIIILISCKGVISGKVQISGKRRLIINNRIER